MTTVQPGERMEVRCAFTRNALPATPAQPVNCHIKPAGGTYGDPVAAAASGSEYVVSLLAPQQPGLYVARFESGDGGIARQVFQVSEG